MNKELTDFLNRHDANSGIVSGIVARLNSLGAETLADAWAMAAPEDLVWGVTRPGVMSAEQRRLFLVFVLESIEDKLTDARSKNILYKLRTKSPITRADAEDAYAAAYAADEDAAWARDAAYAAAYAAAAYAADAEAAAAASWAAAYRAVDAASLAAAAAEDAADAARADAYAYAAYAAASSAEDAADAARADAAADAAAREAQARWIRENFALSDLNIN